MGGIVPTEYGGSGLDFVSNTIILEEISRACHAVACALVLPERISRLGALALRKRRAEAEVPDAVVEG